MRTAIALVLFVSAVICSAPAFGQEQDIYKDPTLAPWANLVWKQLGAKQWDALLDTLIKAESELSDKASVYDVARLIKGDNYQALMPVLKKRVSGKKGNLVLRLLLLSGFGSSPGGSTEFRKLVNGLTAELGEDTGLWAVLAEICLNYRADPEMMRYSLELTRTLVKRDPENWHCSYMYLMAINYFKQEAEVQVESQRVLKRWPKNKDLLCEVESVCENAKQWSSAVDAAKRLVQLVNPNEVTSEKFSLAKLYEKAGMTAEAIQLYGELKNDESVGPGDREVADEALARLRPRQRSEE